MHRFEDTCNVYVVCDRDEAIAIDFGSGDWLAKYKSLGLPPLRRVYLTHHHPDQWNGLLDEKNAVGLEIHAPVGEESFYSEEGIAALSSLQGGMGWFPRKTYDFSPQGLAAGRIQHDLKGFSDHYWLNRRLRFVLTPGHGAHAISVVLDHDGRQLVFCGDAAYAGGTIHQPYHLEWDHWTPTGALAAWQGVERLAGLGMDLLLPSHGPVIDHLPRRQLARLSSRLLDFISSKGSICPGEKDHYLVPNRMLASGAMELLPGLFWFRNGSYLLASRSGEALVTDPSGDLGKLDALLEELPGVRVTALAVTHIHGDHMNAVEEARSRFGAALWLHPWVAAMLKRGCQRDIPFLTNTPVHADGLWPEEGEWTWNEFTFRIAPMPGQTWWHCGFMTTVAGKRVFFGGDTFQPASRWNGTGGFCSINGSRFREGFASTARKILQWEPDILVNGHGTWRHFRPSYFRKAIRWAHRAEAAVAALCPSGSLEKDYYLHSLPPEPINFIYDQSRSRTDSPCESIS